MNQLKTVLNKELRSYFLSPVALIFLGIFLVINLFVFFTYSTFFARNIADIRPLFSWLPILLIFLVAAISMRSWSEEQSEGTLEILMTLPVSTWALVLGKLAAGMALVLVALTLTLPLPIMVSSMGDLDWGPVIGGYIGAIFLAAAYMTLGMCVSARTKNQLVSLMITGIIGGLLYLIGSKSVTGFFSTDTANLLKALGSGSRFTNIERGVLDIRDIVYYTSIAGFLVTLNVHFINMKRTVGNTLQFTGKYLFVSLVALNAVALNLWLAPVSSARADLTANGQFSISDSTKKIISKLNEPLTIAGYFSDKTHPLLAPLVPGIKDFLMEYKNLGNVKVSFENPNSDEQLEQEIAQSYNIRSLPFKVAARHQESVVNAFFHILIKYGDQYEVLSINDLIDVDGNGDQVDVRLKNLEYDITKAVKKVSSGFQSIESVFASMKDNASLTLYFTPSTLPKDYKEIPERIKTACDELAAKSAGKFSCEQKNIEGNDAEQQRLMNELGFRPMATDLFAQNTFFLHLLLKTGNKQQQIVLQGTPTEAAIKNTLEGAFKRSTPGFMKTIGLFTQKPKPPQPNPNLPPQLQPPPPQPNFNVLEQHLKQEFKVNRVQLEDGIVPGDIDVLIVGKTGPMSDKQKFAIDQYLMAGGAVIALAGDKKIEAGRQGIDAVTTDDSLKDLLKTWGVSIEPGFVLDLQNASFPVPVEQQQGMFVMRKIKMMDYPFFPDIRKNGFKNDHMATSGLQSLVYNWGSAIKPEETKDVKTSVILTTSNEAWIRTDTQILPTSMESASDDFAPPDKLEQYSLAATLEGSFKSYFADKDSPLFTNEEPENKDGKKIDKTGRTLKKSNNGRLAVIGSSEFLSDITAQVGRQIAGNSYAGNFQFARNLIDWTTADTDLLQIRTSGAFARTLAPLKDDEQTLWESLNYLFVLLSLISIGAVAHVRRKKVKSIFSGETNK